MPLLRSGRREIGVVEWTGFDSSLNLRCRHVFVFSEGLWSWVNSMDQSAAAAVVLCVVSGP